MLGQQRPSQQSNQPQSYNHLLKVLLLGDGSVGKSSLMKRFISDEFDPVRTHTIGVEFLNKEIRREKHVYTLQIWDTAGQERFRTLRTPFYRGTEICFLVFALNKLESFKNLSLWRAEFASYTDLDNPELFPFVVLGNKCDLQPEERVVSGEEAAAWCAANGGIPYFETSAKTAVNVEEAFKAGIERWIQLETAPGSGESWSAFPKSSTSSRTLKLTSRNSEGGGALTSSSSQSSSCSC